MAKKKKFKYIAKDNAGQEVDGVISARNREEVAAKLRHQGLTLVKIEEKKSAFDIQIGEQKVTLDELVIFTRQLSTMITAGIALLESLEILQEQQENPTFAKALNDVIDRIRSGSDFSASLTFHKKIFPKIYISMVRAGEASGQLDIILTRLAEYQEATSKLIREIKSAMTYPIISLALIFGITMFLMVGIIPKFKEIFTSLGVDLPPLTTFLLKLSDLIIEQGGYMILGMILLIIAAKMYKKTKIGAFHFDWIKLKLPIFFLLFQKVAISRFARTFSTLISSGVTLLAALEIVGQTSGNILMEQAMQESMRNVKEGEPLAEPLSKFWMFPPMVTRMVSIGERSGALEALLEKISEFYDQQVSATVEQLTSLIEPLMIGTMGFIVGGIVLAVFLPIFKLQATLSG